MLERRGIISGYEGSKPRRVLVAKATSDACSQAFARASPAERRQSPVTASAPPGWLQWAAMRNGKAIGALLCAFLAIALLVAGAAVPTLRGRRRPAAGARRRAAGRRSSRWLRSHSRAGRGSTSSARSAASAGTASPSAARDSQRGRVARFAHRGARGRRLRGSRLRPRLNGRLVGRLDSEVRVFEIGNSLRDARVRQGLELTSLEAETKIRAKYLRALEEEQFEQLPGDTYVKGFLRTYADRLGLDGQLYVDEYNSRFSLDRGAAGFTPTSPPVSPAPATRVPRGRSSRSPGFSPSRCSSSPPGSSPVPTRRCRRPPAATHGSAHRPARRTAEAAGAPRSRRSSSPRDRRLEPRRGAARLRRRRSRVGGDDHEGRGEPAVHGQEALGRGCEADEPPR